MLNVNYEHSITYSGLQNQFFTLESILADYKENLSLPPSPVPSLSSVIASPLLNPLYYRHVSAFIPLCPRPAEPFSVGVLFCVEPFLRPSFRSPSAPTPPPSSVSHSLLCEAHLPGWFTEASPAWTHTWTQTTSWYISNLAPCAGIMKCQTIIL